MLKIKKSNFVASEWEGAAETAHGESKERNRSWLGILTWPRLVVYVVFGPWAMTGPDVL